MNYEEIRKETEQHFKRIHDNFSKLFGTDDFWIAGGAIRDFVQSCSDPKDYDIFVTSIDTELSIVETLEIAGFEMVVKRDNSSVWEKDGDVAFDVVRVDLEPNSLVMDDFDLTCCTAQFGPDGFRCHKNFFRDVRLQELYMNNIKLPYYTYKRIAKHILKGYTVKPYVLAKVMDFAVDEMRDIATEAPRSNSPESEKSSSL